MDTDKLRVAIINPDRCKPKKCAQECGKSCPVNKTGKICIEVTKASKICFISETLCIGCGMCIKRCPFAAIQIINLPKGLENQVTHRYGANSFKLHRLPTPRSGEVLGLVGTNGIGKSTALRVLSGNMKPNLGQFENPPDWKEILKFFRGSELQNFFQKMLENNMKALIKIQYVDSIAKSKAAKLVVGQRLRVVDKREMYDHAVEMLDLDAVLGREIGQLSGGELQRFIIAMTCVQQADIYMFDEPSSYLDVKQRLKASRMIRSLLQPLTYVVVVEHDLSILDYLSDFICCLYGTPGAYGVVTLPMSVRQGINIFLSGFIPAENLRFRDFELTFRVTEQSEVVSLIDAADDKPGEDKKTTSRMTYYYPRMIKTLGPFKLEVMAGSFKPSEVVMMLGQNGTGKTTLIKMLAGILKPDDEELEMPKLSISYKPQTIAPKFQGSVQELLYTKLKDSWNSSIFKTEVLIPLQIECLLDNDVQTLSGGELQRVAIVLALAKPCDIFLIDEPSAYLDSEQRVLASKVMKRWILSSKRSAFIVEHDFIMATYLADKVICFEGIPAKESVCTGPESMISGMNKFLKMMEITFRRDPTNFRPRINKYGSQKDQEQKSAGNYFLMDAEKLTKEEEEEEKMMEAAGLPGKSGGKGGKKGGGKKDKEN